MGINVHQLEISRLKKKKVEQIRIINSETTIRQTVPSQLKRLILVFFKYSFERGGKKNE